MTKAKLRKIRLAGDRPLILDCHCLKNDLTNIASLYHKKRKDLQVMNHF